MKKNIEYFIKDIWYILPVILTAILSFGFVITHYSVNVDTLSYERYFRQGELLAQNRFGTIIIDKLFGIMEFNPFFVDFLAVIFFIISAIAFCIFFRNFTGDKINKIVYTIFSCLFISYPLITEIFVYTPAGLSIAISFFGIAVCLNLINKYIREQKRKYLVYISIILIVVISSYESFAPVFLCCIFFVLILECIYNKDKIQVKEVAKTFAILVIILAISILIGQTIATSIRNIYNIKPSKNPAKEILYINNSLVATLSNLIRTVTVSYTIKGLYYLPITILIVAELINYILSIYYSIKKRSLTVFVLFIGTRLSVLSLSIIQGGATPYRTCQVFGLFVAFTFMIFMQCVLNSRASKIVKNIIISLIFVLIFYQAKDMHKWFYLNYVRYEQEKASLIKTANYIEENCDLNKPVIFICCYPESKYISNRTNVDKKDMRYKIAKKLSDDIFKLGDDALDTAIVESNIISYLNWGTTAFGEANTEIFKWLEMLGYDFKQGDMNVLREAFFTSINEQIPEYPNKGYIKETDDIIIVKYKEGWKIK